jgi:hypothetical protein
MLEHLSALVSLWYLYAEAGLSVFISFKCCVGLGFPIIEVKMLYNKGYSNNSYKMMYIEYLFQSTKNFLLLKNTPTDKASGT